MTYYITAGINNHIPPSTILQLGKLYEAIPIANRDYFQRLEITTSYYHNAFVHQVNLMQETFKLSYLIPALTSLHGRIFVI